MGNTYERRKANAIKFMEKYGEADGERGGEPLALMHEVWVNNECRTGKGLRSLWVSREKREQG